MYALKKKSSLPLLLSIHMKESWQNTRRVILFASIPVWEISVYVCSVWEDPSSCTLMIYSLCYIYPWDTEGKHYSNSCSLIPSGLSGRKSTEWGRTTLSFLEQIPPVSTAVSRTLHSPPAWSNSGPSFARHLLPCLLLWETTTNLLRAGDLSFHISGTFLAWNTQNRILQTQQAGTKCFLITGLEK